MGQRNKQEIFWSLTRRRIWMILGLNLRKIYFSHSGLINKAWRRIKLIVLKQIYRMAKAELEKLNNSYQKF